MRKFRIVMWNGPESNFGCSLKGNLKFDFAWPCENFSQSCEMLQEGEIGVDAFSTSHNHAKLLELVRNCWISCEMGILLLNSIFLGEEASERPLRWCQVSTWPWLINRNLIYSVKKTFRYFLIVEFSKYSLSRIFYFPSFSLIFSLAKHVLWDQISKHEWLNLVFLEGGRI